MVISEMVKQWRILNDAHAEATDAHPHPGDGMITVYIAVGITVYSSMYPTVCITIKGQLRTRRDHI